LWRVLTFSVSIYLEKQKKNIETLRLSGKSFSILAEKIRKFSVKLNCNISRWDYRVIELT